MVDVRHTSHNDRVMLPGGPTLFYAKGPTERDWIDRPAYPSMTKEYTGATVPRFRNNARSDQSHFRGFQVAQSVSFSNAPVSGVFSQVSPLAHYPVATRLQRSVAHGPLASYPSMPQHPVASQVPTGRPYGGLSQRPNHHIQPAHVAKVLLKPALHLFSLLLTCLLTHIHIQMPQREVCRKFQAGTCDWGDRCHHVHVLEGGLYAPNFVAPTRRGPPDVPPGQLAPPLHPASTVRSIVRVNSNNTDNPERAASTGPSGLARPVGATAPDARSSKLPSVNHPQLPRPPTFQPGVAPPMDVAPQAARLEPENLDVDRLMRAAELDPRPSRVSRI